MTISFIEDYEGYTRTEQILKNLTQKERGVAKSHHPFLAFRMIRRFVINFNDIVALMEKLNNESTGTFG